MSIHSAKHAHKNSAFTLAEILIAMSISILIGLGVILFTIQGTQISLKTNSDVINDVNQWSIESLISTDSKTGNGACIYADLSATNVTLANRRVYVNTGGNFLIITRSSVNPTTKKTIYNSITGYLYDPVKSTLSKFVYIPTETTDDLESIINANAANFQFRTLASQLTPVRYINGTASAFMITARTGVGIITNSMAFRINNGNAINGMQVSRIFEASFIVRN